jgi:hypothetical protein
LKEREMIKSKPECPFHKPPKFYVNSETDEGYEGVPECELEGTLCLDDYGIPCSVYTDFLKETNEI